MPETDSPRGRRFPLGQVLATPGALRALGADPEAATRAIADLVTRHATGDWGDLCKSDRQANETALRHGYRIVSSYTVGGTKLWIITEADRSSTTVLLPEEY